MWAAGHGRPSKGGLDDFQKVLATVPNCRASQKKTAQKNLGHAEDRRRVESIEDVQADRGAFTILQPPVRQFPNDSKSCSQGS